MEAQKTLKIVNGVNLDTLLTTIKHIQEDPELAKCKFHITNKWISGTHSESTVESFYGAKQEISHESTFNLDSDEPKILAGSDIGPNAAEHLLNALGACITTGLVAHAAVRGIHIEELESEIEGDIDIRGFLGLSPDVPKELTEIRIKVKAKTDPHNIEQLRELAEFSPVYHTLMKGVNVKLDVEQQ